MRYAPYVHPRLDSIHKLCLAFLIAKEMSLLQVPTTDPRIGLYKGHVVRVSSTPSERKYYWTWHWSIEEPLTWQKKNTSRRRWGKDIAHPPTPVLRLSFQNISKIFRSLKSPILIWVRAYGTCNKWPSQTADQPTAPRGTLNTNRVSRQLEHS